MESLTREEQEQRWQEMATRVDKITDRLDTPVDEGIKETVIVLNLLGFRTVQSCEGHTEYGVCSPWVDLRPVEVEALHEPVKQAERDCQRVREALHTLQEIEALVQRLQAARAEMEAPLFRLAGQLMALLNVFYQERMVPHDQRLVLHAFTTSFRLHCHGAFLQEIAALPEREAKLRDYQEEMRAFTAFLKERFFAQ